MFDPYHKWLGIPPGKRPPTYYQLLAISEGEKDRDVIEAATVRQSAYIRNFQKGPNAELATQLLAEISEARAVLTDPTQRKAYDDKLAAEQPKPARPPSRVATAVPAPTVVVRAAPVAKVPPAVPRPVPATRSGRRKTTARISVPALVGIIAGVAVATGAGVYIVTRGASSEQTAATDAGTAKNFAGQSAANGSTGKPFDTVSHPPEQGKAERPAGVPAQDPGPPPGFGRPPNFGPAGFGPPKGFGPPPTSFRPPGGAGAPPANTGPAGAFGSKGSDAPAKPPGQSPPPKQPEKHDGNAVDVALDLLRTRNVFNMDDGAKRLAAMAVEEPRRAQVAKVINDLLVGEKNLPQTLYDAAAVWGDDETVQIIGDKLEARPWVEQGAIRAAGRMKNPKLALPLCRLLENFFNWEDASRALQQMGPAAEDRVRTLVTSHRDPKMRVQACVILARIGTEKSLPALRKAAGDRNTALAAKAAIQEINDRLKTAKESDPDDDTKPSVKK